VTVVAVDLGTRYYGKEDIRILVVGPPDGGLGMVYEQRISVLLRDGLDESYLAGDNTRLVTSDAQRNLAVRISTESAGEPVEATAIEIAYEIWRRYPFVPEVEVGLARRPWTAMTMAEPSCASGHGFMCGGSEDQVSRVTVSGGEREILSGIEGLRLLLATGSRFEGFLSDDMTPNEPVADRAIAGDLSIHWVPLSAEVDFPVLRSSLRGAIMSAFQGVRSESVQHLLTSMCAEAIQKVPEVERVVLRFESIALGMVHGGSETVDGAQSSRMREARVHTMTELPRAVTSVSMERGNHVPK
jgi:urate oxidase